MIDLETNQEHVAPLGLEHHTPRRLNNRTTFYTDIKVRHFMITLHQEAFPELAQQMRDNPRQATNIYSAFLAMLPLKAKDKLTPELKEKILKTFKVI